MVESGLLAVFARGEEFHQLAVYRLHLEFHQRVGFHQNAACRQHLESRQLLAFHLHGAFR